MGSYVQCVLMHYSNIIMSCVAFVCGTNVYVLKLYFNDFRGCLFVFIKAYMSLVTHPNNIIHLILLN